MEDVRLLIARAKKHQTLMCLRMCEAAGVPFVLRRRKMAEYEPADEISEFVREEFRHPTGVNLQV